jgi:dTDP-4-dehydrorhamnose reductase
MRHDQILVTGGSGLLGRELRGLAPDLICPARAEFDVTDPDQMERFIAGKGLRAVLHAAAFTSPPLCDKEPERAIAVNITGTANVARLCLRHGLKLVYVSTDYVFSGDKEGGGYREEDPVHPVNKYAWSKLGGECAARLLDDALIIRTSFGPNRFPYPKAFVDQWTSRQSVREIAGKILALLDRHLEERGVIHLGGPRRTVYEYARSLDPDQPIGQLSIRDVSFKAPADTSLNCERYAALEPERAAK